MSNREGWTTPSTEQHATVAPVGAIGLATLARRLGKGTRTVQRLLVDRFDEDDAVILIGDQTRAFLLPRRRLQTAGIDSERAQGILEITRTGDGATVDVWPLAGYVDKPAWAPDADLLAVLEDMRASATSALDILKSV